MLVLALDTTTRRGSAALWRDGALLGCEIGDAATPHGTRLPGDLIRLLERHNVAVGAIDVFAVTAGPGSFTGLRIGIAAMQGLALANGRTMVGISALDALNSAVCLTLSHQPPPPRGEAALRRGSPKPGEGGLALASDVATWMDAARGEVFSALYHGDKTVDGPSVELPIDVLSRWKNRGGSAPVTFVGEGAVVYTDLIRRSLPNATILDDVPPLAPTVARLAEAEAARGGGLPPGAIRPIYVRRPDVELNKVKGTRFRVQGSEPAEPSTLNPARRTPKV